jgi:rubrerythrin
MNKYLTKIASDLEIAKEYHKDEEHDVKKYTDELKTAKNPVLRKALEFALPEEKQHAAKFKAAVEDMK